MDDLFPLTPDARDRVKWLINLRWIACAGLAAVILLAAYGLVPTLRVKELLLANLAVAVLNALYLLTLRAVGSRGARRLIRVQIFLDLTVLTLLLHLSGGFENPFVLFFVFHMVIASILLSNRAAYLAATFAVLLFGGTAAAERLALLPHHHLAGVHSAELYFDSPAYLPAVFSAFAATLYIVVYMSTSIVNRLRMREAELVGKDRVKSQYVQTLSHDIRGSLAAIQSLTGINQTNTTRKTAIKARIISGRPKST